MTVTYIHGPGLECKCICTKLPIPVYCNVRTCTCIVQVQHLEITGWSTSSSADFPNTTSTAMICVLSRLWECESSWNHCWRVFWTKWCQKVWMTGGHAALIYLWVIYYCMLGWGVVQEPHFKLAISADSSIYMRLSPCFLPKDKTYMYSILNSTWQHCLALARDRKQLCSMAMKLMFCLNGYYKT